MATSVDNRHYPTMNGVAHAFKPPLVPSPRSFDRHRHQNQTLDVILTETKIVKETEVITTVVDSYDDSSSDDEDESHNRNVPYYKELVKKSNSDLEPSILDPRDESTADSWIQRNSSMLRLTGKHPFNAEAPLPRLMHHGFITPVPLHYVRNHGAVPKANWSDWSIEITGLVKRPAKFTMEELISEFPSREFPVTLVCAGNRRKEQNMVKQTIGFNWGSAGVSTSLWKGIPLSEILRRCGIYSRRGGALNVCFEGAEDLPGGGGSKYGTSIKKEMAMDPARDIILAYMQNGELLTPDHGFPVRVIVPGFIGGRMVKWLKRIIVTPQESDSYYHYKDNRVLPSLVDAELANSEAWWYKPEYIINELNINSVITTPGHAEILPINAFTTQKPYTLKGYAYSGGGKKVTRVEVTLDGGDTWSVCELDHQEKPNKYGKFWCWCFWSLDVEVLDLLSAKDVAVRAWDESFNTQPDKLIWNLMGMMNNCWFRIRTNVCKPHRGEIGIVFEHPTRPGNQSGGWMAKERQLEISSESNNTLKKSVSSPFMNTASKMYSISEVRKHNTADSAWIIVHGHIYDCTRFLKDHPGGTDSILINAGTDCTEEFEAIHSDKAKKLLEDYRIGELITTGYDSSPNVSVHGASNFGPLLAPIKELTPQKNIALVNPREKIPVRLIEKTSISHDVRKFRFALPSEDQQLGLPVGKHVFVCANINDKLCLRAYTPTSAIDAVGHIDLVVKVYFKDVHPRFPNGGLMSQHLDSLPIGSMIDIKGPLGHIEYKGKGNFLVSGKPKFAKKLAMLAGGTGITPIYQIIQSILSDPEDETEMYVVYANRTEDDILVREELEGWASKHKERLKIWYVVEIAKEGWSYSTGFITEAVLREHIPEGLEGESLALACGPPPMIQFALQPNLEKMGYNVKEDLLIF
ncbi:Nitrate reductase [NADH] 1 [Arabidopsis thaliana]|uniref:Nitrate reductase [NADH] 1 n=5 Tax=Arabidopsis TaxID=3701 RepID=NIA1_ARATH|nr:nitrate reductase 1 [Arabidopsis thaliana]P11832.3 RecName: Full=Nitrate reductase [NADH] 1; Short=NR1 [Arabidopsis thaliana]KAG7652076.1 Ferredoxin-NADP reductase (FNR) nucleotide-binding domain [Arabidopsis thaliana x Arabidopsis arenosa]KAG7659937.1 Ferredoxin-NADP reductase (FNR) nucleotide-binding domain [Arabidopsis suecica]AAG51627.1 nitrate reductase 1 (NR1); 46724-43362 [Arabidopsis thaliana]AAL11617.1 At1g77760/T32E8_9 [Arabidopsis thaliana]AAM13997.1 putative nitrate reductase 1|eukprot:NP_177899.1 nitrate reductase 1 [Arabidopsis thaliana]